ncbi:MAG: hypothetical protein RI900_361 [Actinomycetota bacterium]
MFTLTGRLGSRCAGLLAIAAATVAVGMGPAAQAAPATPLAPHAAGRIIVGFKAAASATERIGAFNRHGAKAHQPLRTRGSATEVVTLPAGVSVEQALASYKADPAVRYAEPDYVLTHQAVSNDPEFTNGALWGMQGDASTPANQFGSGAAEAWAANYTGSSSVVVGVIDEGIQVTHPDLAANIWTNPGEVAGNGLDDDANGFIDDINGWDFFNRDNSVFDGAANPVIDEHGTHVSGTIGGVGGNGVGVAGVNWNVKIVSAKFLGPTGGNTTDAVSAINYLVDLKARRGVNLVAINNSWGGGAFSQALSDAINAAGDQNILFVAAAGNSGTNNDVTPSYPSNYDCSRGGTRGWDCVLAVAAIDSAGAIATFSQYGATTVDIGAPGVNIISTVPNGAYASFNGTSMATPHVTGAAALCASLDPTMSGAAIRAAIMQSAAPTASMVGRTVSGGRLDVGAMVSRCVSSPNPVTGAPSGLTATATGPSTATLSWTDGVTDETVYQVERATATAGVCGAFALVATLGANSTSYSAAGLSPSTTYCFQVRAGNGFGGGSYSNYSEVAQATTAAPPPQFVCSGTTYSWIDATVGGTRYVLTDDSAASVTLPFAFPLYGVPHTTASISSNGFLRLGSGAATAFTNAGIPNLADPNNMIAAWWDDLNPALGGAIWSRTLGTSPNRQFVASWNGVPHVAAATTGVSFQIVLDEATGDVTMQYLDTRTGSTTSDRGIGATTGIEGSNGTDGTQVSVNLAARDDLTAIRCTTGSTAPLAVGTASLPGAATATAYSQMLAATGGRMSYTWALAAGALPSGITLNATTGLLSGTPTVAGTSNFTVRVTDASAATATKAFTVVVTAPLAISTASLPGGSVGTAYSATLAATGGAAPYTWSLSAGALPAGLSLNATTGAITGTPTAGGTASFTVRVTDSAARTVTRALSIAVTVPAPPGAFNKTAPANNATGRSRTALTLSWGASTGATRYEYCFDTVNDNLCNGTWVSTGTGRSVVVGGLGSRVIYYWQVRAVNGVGTTLANAGTWWRFTTAV